MTGGKGETEKRIAIWAALQQICRRRGKQRSKVREKKRGDGESERWSQSKGSASWDAPGDLGMPE